MTAKSRGGWSVTFRLSYNSQMWRRDANGEWLLGHDVGYGFGWKLLAGAVTPVWSSGQIAYYLFTDSTGAEYRLDQNNGNVWRSVQGIYVAFNANNGRLQFPDGTFWVMGCQSSGGEADAGTLYPTTMQDSNGNYITIAYAWGAGWGGPNSSARITGVFDGRPYVSGVASFSFNYNGSRLVSITNAIYTPEAYTFTHVGGQTLLSPFTSASFGTATFLQSVGSTGLGIATNFNYNTSGEMTQMTTPLGGVLQWTFEMLPTLMVLALGFVPQANVVPVGFCDVLGHLSDHAGRRVTIRTQLVLTKEGTFMRDARCSQGPITAGFEWPPFIAWVFPSQKEVLPAEYRFDNLAFSKFSEAVKATQMSPAALTVTATVSGILATEPNPKFIRGGDGSIKPAGFGHLGQFPAELLVESIRDWVVIAPRKE